MHGRTIVGDVKEWKNPWLNNRWALFAANLLALVLLGNTWDGLSEVVITIPRVMTKTLCLVLVIAGLVFLGRGNALGVAGPILLYGSQWMGVRQLMHDANRSDELAAATVALGGLAAVHILVIGIYNFQRRRRMPAS